MKSGKAGEQVLPCGNLDGVYHQSLTGWFSKDGTDDESELVLLVNGEPKLRTVTNLPRPDVENQLGFGCTSGFCFNLEELGDERVIDVSICHEGSGYTFNNANISYCRGISQHFELIRDIFYPEYYRCRYDCCHLSNEEAFQDFIKVGIFNDKDPNPWFSNAHYRKAYPARVKNGEVPLLCYLATESGLEEKASNLFDPQFYRDCYPDLENAHSLLWHYSVYGKDEGRVGIERLLPDCIKTEFEEISEIEPSVVSATKTLDTIVRYPHITKATYLPKIIHEMVGDEIEAVICVPFISRGGADLVSTFLFRAYQGALGKDKVLMLVTDKASIEVPEWIDDGSKVIVLDEESSFIDEEEKLNALHICLGRIAPQKIININSHATWKLFERYGVQLSTVADLYAYLFCFDYDTDRNKVGYITQYLPTTLRCLKSVYFDNKKIVQDIEKLFGFSQSEMAKMHTVYIPASEPVELLSPDAEITRDTILWAGRLSIQKRPDILVDIAAAIPSQKFDVYGQAGNSEYSKKIIDGEYPNIRYRGVYNKPEQVNFNQYMAFLNTSEWDGIPTIIIQMLAMGMPLITSSVGGISELVTHENGWVVDEFDDIDTYVLMIRRMIIQQDLVAEKSAKGITAIAEKHTWHGYYKKLESLNAFADHHSMSRVAVKFKDRRKAA